MSHWDFGHPADGQQDAPRRSGRLAPLPAGPAGRYGRRRVAGTGRVARGRGLAGAGRMAGR